MKQRSYLAKICRKIPLSCYHIRRLTCFGILAIVIYFAIVSFWAYSETFNGRKVHWQWTISTNRSRRSNPEIWPGHQACKHPLLEVENPEMMKFVQHESPLQCSPEKDWVEVVGSTATVTEEVKKKYGNIKCSFTDILRVDDHSNKMGNTTSSLIYNFKESDAVKVDCSSKSGKRWSNILSGIRNDQRILDRTGWHFLPPSALKLNVLMFGFDSVSRNCFIRKMPKSHHYIKDVLNGVILEGYNIIGDGTPQALIPILTGKKEREMPDTRKRMGSKANYVNVYPFIWNKFREYGYVTAYAEDSPDIGTFTFRLKGFKEPPTDHYMRPFFVEVLNVSKLHRPYCMGSLPRHKIMMDYAKHIYRVYRDRPKFIFDFVGEVSHNSYNMVEAADDDLVEFLNWLKSEGHLNNTLLIVMSDHGQRFAAIRNTQQGKLEERLPWFSFIFPPWFESTYPKAIENLKINIHRLSTPLDINPTLLSVLYPPPFTKGSIKNRSMSLLQEIPPERTCADADVPQHWCACLTWEEVELNDPIVVSAAHALIDKINKYNSLYSDQCYKLELTKILWAAHLAPSEELTKFKQSRDWEGWLPDLTGYTKEKRRVYQIKVVATPSGAIFEASISYDTSRNDYYLIIDEVSRINKYGSQARCIENTQEQLRKFCHCKK